MLRVEDRHVALGSRAIDDHLEIWFARAAVDKQHGRLIRKPRRGVRHLSIDLSQTKPSARLLFPSSKKAKDHPLVGSLSLEKDGYSVDFELPYAEAIGGSRRASGSLQPVESFRENEVLLFSLVVVDGDGQKAERTLASTRQFEPGVPATFGRLVLTATGGRPEVSAALLDTAQ